MEQITAKPIGQILPQVLTEMQEPITREQQLITEMQQSSRRNAPEYNEFKTLGDPVLERMAQNAALFEAGFTEDSSPRWLSFVGGSGTGKTFLSEILYQRASGVRSLFEHNSLLSGVHKAFWPQLLSELRDGKYWLIQDLADANFLFLDEIAVEHDPSGFGRDKLCEVLTRRVGKWTLITSNLTLEKLAEIDTRISSRMIRGGSITCDCQTTDYNLRAL